MSGDVIIEVRNLKRYFPIHGGLLQRAVDQRDQLRPRDVARVEQRLPERRLQLPNSRIAAEPRNRPRPRAGVAR